jgi:hypothetical protein
VDIEFRIILRIRVYGLVERFIVMECLRPDLALDATRPPSRRRELRLNAGLHNSPKEVCSGKLKLISKGPGVGIGLGDSEIFTLNTCILSEEKRDPIQA